MKKKWLISAAAVAAALFVAGSADRADAAGVHFQAGRLHVDFGDPHDAHARYGRGRGGYAYGGPRGQHAYRGHRGYGGRSYHGYRGGYRTWHDTTHLDWHPGGHVRHGNHYDYIPGHYDVHHDGHWDYHR